MMNSEAYRLLDVGGTYIKCADGSQVPVPSGGSREAIAAALKKAVGPTDGLRGIAVAIPGPFDFTQGIFLMEHKFAAVKGQRFRSLAEVPETVPLRFQICSMSKSASCFIYKLYCPAINNLIFG